MPSSLADSIVWHHDPAWAERRTPAAIIYTANRLAHRYGFGCAADTSDLLEDPIVNEVGVDVARLAQLDAAAPEMFDSARQVVRM